MNLLLKHNNCESAIYLTAWNPFSQTLNEAQNRLRQIDLEKDISDLRLSYLRGYGKGDIGTWPAEPSILILGLSLESGKLLAQKYEQNAFLWCDKNAVPELILMR